MVDEHWLPVAGYDGFYEVSSFGRVRSVERTVRGRNRWGEFGKKLASKLKKPTVDPDGYHQVRLFKGSQGASKRVSRLVLEAFAGPGIGLEARHINHDPSNNHLSNLEWGTRQDNENDKSKSGRRPRTTVGKLTQEDAGKIRQLHAATRLTQREIGVMFSTHHSNVSLILRGKTWLQP